MSPNKSFCPEVALDRYCVEFSNEESLRPLGESVVQFKEGHKIDVLKEGVIEIDVFKEGVIEIDVLKEGVTETDVLKDGVIEIDVLREGIV